MAALVLKPALVLVCVAVVALATAIARALGPATVAVCGITVTRVVRAMVNANIIVVAVGIAVPLLCFNSTVVLLRGCEIVIIVAFYRRFRLVCSLHFYMKLN